MSLDVSEAMVVSEVSREDVSTTGSLPADFDKAAEPRGSIIQTLREYWASRYDDLTPLSPADQDAHESASKASGWQEPWREGVFQTHALGHSFNTHYVYAPAQNPRAVIRFLTGLKSLSRYYIDDIQFFNEHGISVVMGNLPDFGNKIGFFELHEAVAKNFFFYKNPVIGDIPEDCLEITLSHSASSLHLTNLLRDEGVINQLAEESPDIVMLSPFYISDFRTNALQNYAYKVHSFLNGQYEYGSTIADKFHQAYTRHLLGEPDVTTAPRQMSHDQIWYMVDKGQELLESFRESGFPSALRKDLRVHMYIGKHDYVACPKAAEEVAGLMGIGQNFHLAEGTFHNPILERKGARRALLKIIESALERKQPRYHSSLWPKEVAGIYLERTQEPA